MIIILLLLLLLGVLLLLIQPESVHSHVQLGSRVHFLLSVHLRKDFYSLNDMMTKRAI